MIEMIDVLVVGAGPTGLTLATLLRRSGLSVRIIDKNDEPAKESRAIGIQARTLELFQSIDLEKPFLEQGMIAAGVDLFLKGQERLSVDLSDMARPDTPYPFMFLLSQAKTERILLEDLKKQGLEVDRQTNLIGFTQDSSGVQAKLLLADGRQEEVSAQYIVGCDGAHSSVRRALGLAFKGEAYASEFILADAHVDWPLAQNKLMIFMNPGSFGAYFPQREFHKGQSISRVLSVRRYKTRTAAPDTSATTAFPATLEEIQTGFQQASMQEVALSEPEWITKYHVHHRSVAQTRVGRAFLAGDASHIHSPVGAQGMNTGIQDAANLAWKLASVIAGTSPEPLLDTYHSERWPIGQRLLKYTDRMFTLAMTTNPILTGVRDFIFPIVAKLLMKYPAGKRAIFRFVSQLSIHYDKSSAARERTMPSASESFKKTLPTGARAPNAQINDQLELFDLVKGYKFHLLILSRSTISGDRREKLRRLWATSKRYPKMEIEQHWISSLPSNHPDVIHCRDEEIFTRFGVTQQGVFLIRPDGYVGFRADDLEKAFSRQNLDGQAEPPDHNTPRGKNAPKSNIRTPHRTPSQIPANRAPERPSEAPNA